MERLTTDTPNGNFETILNFVHGKDGWAHIYDEDGKEVNLITWALNHCHDRGCDDFQCETLEEYDEALSSCMMDYMDCPIAMAYCFASQAVHLRSRLKMYEDTGLEPETVEQIKLALMGKVVAEVEEFDGISIDRMKELAQAEKDGRLVVLPCKVGAYVWVDGRKAIVEEFFGYKTERYLQAQFYDNMQYVDIPFEEIGKTVFLTREEAEAALKEREEVACHGEGYFA